MADDTIWDYIEDFNDGKNKEKIWVLVKFKYPTHQIVFTTDRALKQFTLRGAMKYEKINSFRMKKRQVKKTVSFVLRKINTTVRFQN